MADPSREPKRGGAVVAIVAGLFAALGLGGTLHWLRQRNTPAAREQARQAAVVAQRGPGHETSDVSFARLAAIVAGSLVVLALIGAGLFGIFTFFVNQPPSTDGPVTQLNDAEQLPAGPRLQADPVGDWLVLRATQTALLNSSGVDPTSGVIHIPISQAMDLVATRGISSTYSATPAPAAPAGGTP